jgi:cell division protein FtsN
LPADQNNQANSEPQSSQSSAPGTFAPVEDNPITQQPLMSSAAQAMAPNISRMEPVGRQLTPSASGEAPKPKPNSSQTRTRLTAPPPPQNDLTASNPNPLGPKYTVLLGSFGKQENADTLKNKLLAAGLPATVTEVTLKNKVWFRVMSGSFDNQSAAEAYGRELKQRNLVDNPYIKPM